MLATLCSTVVRPWQDDDRYCRLWNGQSSECAEGLWRGRPSRRGDPRCGDIESSHPPRSAWRRGLCRLHGQPDDQYGLIDPIQRHVTSGKPFLGICLGLQLLFSESEEFGVHKGLNIIPGRVRRFTSGQGVGAHRRWRVHLKVPHMGWNGLLLQRPAPPLRNLSAGSQVYFVHSYYVEPSDPSIVATMTDYGGSFVSSIWRENIFACQFHPEKSQTVGLQVIKNFAEWR